MSQVSRGFIWSAAERFSMQGVGFLLGIIIARIVSPSSYGLIVMIQVFLSFSQLFIDCGFTKALIQKKDRSEIDYYTAFIFNMAVAITIYFIMFIAAPFIADFYNEPQLTNITRVISLNLIISSLSIVQRTRLTINLDFKTQTKAGLIAVIVSGSVGIICAYSGLEVWALVIQGLLSQLMITLSLMYFSRWIPKLYFSVESFKSLFNYGSKLLANNMLTSIYINLFNLVIGKKYSSADLAFFNRGFYIILPLMGLTIVLAYPLIEVVLTSKWLPTAHYLQLFCLNFIFYPLLQQSSSPVAAIGRVGLLLKFEIVKRSFAFCVLIVTIGIGINAICLGVVISTFFEACINVFILKREVGIRYKDLVKSQFDVIILNVCVCLVVYFLIGIIINPLFKLIFGGIVGIILYILGTYLFNLQEKDYYSNFFASVKARINI